MNLPSECTEYTLLEDETGLTMMDIRLFEEDKLKVFSKTKIKK